jgi:hypothetical protein
LNVSGQAELFVAKGGGEMCDEFPAKHLAQHGARKEKPFPAADPGRAIGGKTASGNQAELLFVLAKDIGHFQPMTRHESC